MSSSFGKLRVRHNTGKDAAPNNAYRGAGEVGQAGFDGHLAVLLFFLD